MASVLHRTTLQLRASVHTPNFDSGTWVINPDLSPISGVPRKHWKLTGDVLSEMSQAEKDALAAAEAEQSENSQSGLMENFAEKSLTQEDSTTDNDTWINYLRLSRKGIPAGKYRIGWRYCWGYSSRSTDFMARIRVGGGDIAEHRQEPKDSGRDQRTWTSSWDYYTHAGGDLDVDIEYKPSSSGSAARMHAGALEFWRAGNA